MPSRRIYDQELFTHFITFSCYHRRRLLELDHPKRIVLGVLNEQLEKQSATCVGFVVMPDHVHALLWFSQVGQLSRFMQGWKRRSSFHIHEWWKTMDFSYGQAIDAGDPVWQRKYYSFEINNRNKLEEKLQYLHLNPVRAGMVDRAVDWKWSSARWYESQRTVGVSLG